MSTHIYVHTPHSFIFHSELKTSTLFSLSHSANFNAFMQNSFSQKYENWNYHLRGVACMHPDVE